MLFSLKKKGRSGNITLFNNESSKGHLYNNKKENRDHKTWADLLTKGKAKVPRRRSDSAAMSKKGAPPLKEKKTSIH